MVGCADDLRNRSVFDCGAGDAVIRFSVEDVILTRDGETKDIESVVDHAYLLFYSGEVSLLTDIPLAAVKAEADSSTPGNLKFKMPLSLQPNTDYQVLAIANADDYAPSGFENFGEYLESWYRSSSSEKSPLHLYSSLNITPDSKSNLPMNGGISGSSVFRFSMDNGAYTVSATLSFRRMVARIDVANIVKEGFTVESVALCNWRDAMPVAAYDNQTGNRFGTVQGSLTNESQTFGEEIFVDMPSADEDGIQQLNKAIYCLPSVSYDSFLGDKESTALIIKAKYGEDSASSYYRVNVGMQGNVSKIDPNTKYLVTIRSVKGSGASTPEEAYFATESQIALSVVEGWDLGGNAFDMDDYGNFIVLSKGSLNFEGDATDNAEVRVLTSKGLSWTVEYIADNEVSADAFNIRKLSDIAIEIAPRGVNEEEEPLTGKCRVSATTEAGTTLQVDIALRQDIAEEKPYEPVIPADMPFAIIPESYERVKIDHEKRTIEIDGFDPNCFNSFIDIPFKVYINESFNENVPIDISSNLEWPLEGRVAKEKSNEYLYCEKSFSSLTSTTSQRLVINTSGESVPYNFLKYNVSAKKEDVFYISVGAMGPDDPSIVRKLTLSNNGTKIDYELIVSTPSIIIDNVVLTDHSGSSWMIFDRNLQDITKFEEYIGINENGIKYQAYNYLYMMVWKIEIPFKNLNQNSTLVESKHELYLGYPCQFKNKQNLSLSNGSSSLSWLEKFVYSDGMKRTSPFFEKENYQEWKFPDTSVLELCSKNIKVSKMRMFLVSDIPVKNGNSVIPVCCYWPYFGEEIINSPNSTYGYYTSTNGISPDSMTVLYYDNVQGLFKHLSLSSSSSRSGLSRLVRPLTEDELDNYKQNYLGYGSQKHKLTICHPDTYESTSLGWIPY